MKGGHGMKRLIAIICGVLAFSLAFGFLCVGYAYVTRDIKIEGLAEYTPPEAVFIIDAEPKGSGGTVNGYALTTLSSSVTLGSSASSTERILVTVYNNTDVEQGYNATKHPSGEETYTNSDISYRLIKADTGEELKYKTPVAPDMHLTFYVEFYYKDGKVASNKSLESILLFEFLPMSELPDDEEAVAARGALEKFKEILNDPTSYDRLTGAMDSHDAGNKRSYIGNVVGSKSDDSALIEDLFQGELTLNINGEDVKMTTMIKRENVDGNNKTGDSYDRYSFSTTKGCEMVIYMTDVNLFDYSYGKKVTVYAAVFTCAQDSNGNPTGQWYQVGELFKGTAPVNNYEGGLLSNGSFNTDSWRSDSNKKIEDLI